MKKRDVTLHGLRRHLAGRAFWAWLILAALLGAASLMTSAMAGSIELRLIGSPGSRLTPYPEVAAVLLGVAGAVLTSPRLPTWEASASRRLWPYSALEATTVILISAVTVFLTPLGCGVDPGPVETRAEWRARSLRTLTPYAIGVIGLVALCLALVAVLDQRLGAITAIACVALIWFAQLTPLGTLVPLPGVGGTTLALVTAHGPLFAYPLTPIVAGAAVAGVAGIVLWCTRWQSS